MGSLLWLLERSIVTEQTRRYAETFASEALQPLIDAGACVRVDAAATILQMQNGLTLSISLYGRNGQKIYNRQYEMVWRQALGESLSWPQASQSLPYPFAPAAYELVDETNAPIVDEFGDPIIVDA